LDNHEDELIGDIRFYADNTEDKLIADIRDEHGTGLDRSGSGPILAGSGLDRIEKIYVVLK